jgi:hypothetical protein
MARYANSTHIQDTAEYPADQLNAGQVSVAASATQLLAANSGRRVALITNTHATATLYIGTTSGVTTSTGHPLPAGTSMSISYSGALYGITASATITTGASEIYDVV